MSFICGSFKSQEEEDDDFEVFWSCPSTPSRKTTRKRRFSCIRHKEDKKNPYSDRGLDKYEALLAELDEKRRKIFTQKGSQYISFVHFVYSNSNKANPIIVRLKDPTKHDQKLNYKQNNIEDTTNPSLSKLQDSTLDITNGTKIGTEEAHHAKPSTDKVTNKIRVDQWKQNLKVKLEESWMPSYNLPLFVILVMLFLTFFGRSFAIICTSIAWYLIPKIGHSIENSTAKKIMVKGQHSRKPSENYKVISSPRSFLRGPMNV